MIIPYSLRMGNLVWGQMGYVVIGLTDPQQYQSGTLMVLQSELPWVTEISMTLMMYRFMLEQLVLDRVQDSYEEQEI